MEDKVYKSLTKKEQALLVNFYENTDLMKAVKKAFEVYQSELAHSVLANSPDHDYTLLNRGKAVGARFVFDLAKTATKKENQRRTENA